jgi:hypothetical protein
VLTALTAVAVVLAAVLFVPVTILVTLTSSEGDSAACARIRLRWLVFSWSGGTSDREGRPARAAAAKPSRRRRSRRGFSVRAALASPGLLRQVLRLAVAMSRFVRPDRVRARGRVGFDDPADTGMLLGWLSVLLAVSSDAGGSYVRIQPEFGGEVFEGRAELRWSRSLSSLAWPLARFIASPALWRATRAGFSARF